MPSRPRAALFHQCLTALTTTTHASQNGPSSPIDGQERCVEIAGVDFGRGKAIPAFTLAAPKCRWMRLPTVIPVFLTFVP